MYLSVETVNNINEIPEKKNFTKPYLIKGGCKEMAIFKKSNTSDFVYDSLKDVVFAVEVYNNRKDMAVTNEQTHLNLSFSELLENMNRKNEQKYYYMADIDLDNYNVSKNFKSNFITDFDNINKREGLLMFYGKNTLSGCHFHTSNDYILNQIIGEKTVYMFDYNTENIEYAGVLDVRSNFIKENFFELDHSKMNIYKIDMKPGDSLIIPPWWLHAVEGFDTTMSITKTYNRDDYWYIDKPYIFATNIVCFCYDDIGEMLINFINYIYSDYIHFVIFFLILIIVFLKRRHIYKYIKST